MSSPIQFFTATDRVLTTVELLSRIFQHSSKDYRQNYRNALVSKTWSNEVLSILWSELNSFVPLLKLLGPMSEEEKDGIFCFRYDRHVRPCDWDVFQRYSWRVRKIYHLGGEPEVDDSVIFDLTANPSFPASPLIPNLREIIYDGAGPLLKFIPLFMNESLEILGLYYIEHDAEMMFKRTLSYIPQKAPNLRCLWLIFGDEIHIHPEFDMVLAALPRLKEIWVPPSQFVTSTLNVLAHLPHLELLEVTSSANEQNKLDITATSLEDTFPSLTTFITDTLSFDDIASLIETSKPRNLRKLDVRACSKESRQACRRLIATITSTCPAVQGINVRSYSNQDRSSWHDDDPEADPPIFSFFLSPTHCCLDLTSLVLKDAPRLRLNVEIMRALLASLPSLETLDLNEHEGPPTLPLSSLSELAPLCPHMKSLTLYVDTEQLSTCTPPNTRFSRLKVLDVGSSPLKSSALDVVTFLGMILPKGCMLMLEQEQRAKWKTVIDFLPLILELSTAREG